MERKGYKTILLGELVVAAFDIAAQYSTDPREISRLATKAVIHIMRPWRIPFPGVVTSNRHRYECVT